MLDRRFAGRLRRVLVVEDSAIIAMNLELSLTEMGVEDVVLAADVATAFDMLQAGKIDLALVDILLGKDDGRIIADRLTALDIPFAFMTGFGEPQWAPGPVPSAPILTKPFSNEELAAGAGRALLGLSPGRRSSGFRGFRAALHRQARRAVRLRCAP